MISAIHLRPQAMQTHTNEILLSHLIVTHVYTGCHFWKLYHLQVQRKKTRSEIWRAHSFEKLRNIARKKNIASRLNKLPTSTDGDDLKDVI